ncbi:MAG TPA: FAD-linked oxidase C-terminal domain-containing protein [Planctomycetota bacterium]|nr:FAD-linked oxidase C-terminal domain-containing protein [Planctomycetota bacterium]
MIASGLLSELRRIVGAASVHAGPTDVEVYSYDASLAIGIPDAIVLPASTEEVAAVVRATSAACVPCIPRGFGTNLSGGSIAPRGGVVVCLTRMNRILSIEPERRLAIAQPGVTNLELQAALAPLGFFFAPDPASQKAATLGGNVAENSGGPHCVKYGVMTNHVLGLEVVLPSGEVARTGSGALDPPGYDLRGLLVGSEGTLGIATEMTLRILPLPETVITLLAIYDSVQAAARSVSAIIAHGIVPATLEMMDNPVIRAVEASYPAGYPDDAAAVLIIEVEGPAAGLDAQAQRIEELCTANACRNIRRARDAAERDQLWAGRRGAFGALARIAPSFWVADCTVPRNRLPEALERMAEIAKKFDFPSGNVLHAGDGNLHPLLFFDNRVAEQTHRVHEAGREVMQACVDLGGTITGEHGVGVEKLDGMRLIFSNHDLAFQLAVKRAFDPAQLMNPGKAIPTVAVPPHSPLRIPHSALTDSLAPTSPAEACDAVLAAIAARQALLPMGGGRRADFGNHSERRVVPLHTDKLSSVVEHDADNQTVTFGAGMTLAAAQGFLAPHRQWLPFRPPLAEGCTLGGMVALGACGPERLGYGAPRDSLLGLRFVSGTGRHIKAGGRVIKNVAGYDITRLLAGSAGTLGLLTELTFRVSAVPEICRVLRASGTVAQCSAAARALLSSKLCPAFVTAVPRPDPSRWTLSVGFEGFDVTVRAQLDGCASLVGEAGLGDAETLDYPVLEGFHAGTYRALHDAAFVLRVDVPLDAVAAVVSVALPSGQVLLDFGCGRASLGLALLSDEQWAALCSLAAEAGGHVVAEKASAEFKQRHDVFAPERPDWKAMHRLKAALDPHGVFAPGRLPGRR